MGELLCYLWAGDGGGHLPTFFIPATFLRATLFLHLDGREVEVGVVEIEAEVDGECLFEYCWLCCDMR